MRKDLTRSIKEANVEGTLVGFAIIAFVVFIGWLVGCCTLDGIFVELKGIADLLPDALGGFSYIVLLVFALIANAVLFFLHEFCHYIIYAIFLPKEQKKGLKITIVKGFQPCTVIPNARMSVKLKIAGQISPFIVLGVSLFVAAVLLDSSLMTIIAGIGAGLAGEDVLMTGRLLRFLKHKNAYCEDAPDKIGCYVIYDDEDEKDGD